MNKIFVFLLLVLCVNTVHSQQIIEANKVNALKNLGIPLNDTIDLPYKFGEIRIRPQDTVAYKFNGKTVGKRWNRLQAIDTVFAVNDSIVRFVMDGKNTDIKVKGVGVGANYYTTSQSFDIPTETISITRNGIGSISTSLTGAWPKIQRFLDSCAAIRASITAGGSGTVTTVSIVTANGISGTVTNASTTPAVTLVLGAITPSSTNGVSAATMAFNDATSSIQTQLNSKEVPLTFNNGLTRTSNTVKLGGTLTASSSIDGSSLYNFGFGNLNQFNLGAQARVFIQGYPVSIQSASGGLVIGATSSRLSGQDSLIFATENGPYRYYFTRLPNQSSPTNITVMVYDTITERVYRQSIPSGITNLGYTAAATNGLVTSSTGSSATLPVATTSLAGLFDTLSKRLVDSIHNGTYWAVHTFHINTGKGIYAGGVKSDSLFIVEDSLNVAQDLRLNSGQIQIYYQGAWTNKISVTSLFPSQTGNSGKFLTTDGAGTISWGTASGSGDFSSNTSSSVDGEVVLFSGTGGKTGKRATLTGFAKLASGVLSSVSAITLTTDVTGTLPVANGGSGLASLTAYAVLTGGTTSTGALQQVSGLGTSGYVLTSNGAGNLPTWQAVSGGSSQWTTSGSNIYFNTGKVGIGMSFTPTNLLHIYATSGNDQGLTVENPGTTGGDNPAIVLKNATEGATLFMTNAASGLPSSTGFFTGSPNGFVIYPLGKQVMRALSDKAYFFGDGDGGRTGFGTPTPRQNVDMLYASGPQLRLSYSDNASYTDFTTSASGYLDILPSGGAVGINVSSFPAAFNLPASTTGFAPFNIKTGAAVSSPNDGDMWYDGTHLYFRNVSTNVDLFVGTGGGGGVSSVTGTTNRITSSGGSTPAIDISSSYVGQASIVTTGTLTTGATGAGFTIALSTSTVTGTLADGRLSSNVVLLSGSQTLTGTKTFNDIILPNDAWIKSSADGLNRMYFANGQLTYFNNANGVTFQGSGNIIMDPLAGSGSRMVTCDASGTLSAATIPTSFTNALAIAATLTSYAASAGTVSSSDGIINAIQKLDGNIALKANIASPTFTGTPAAPTPAITDSSTRLATTEFVKQVTAKVYVKDVSTTNATPVSVDTIPITAGADYESVTVRVTCTAVLLSVATGYFTSVKTATFVGGTAGAGGITTYNEINDQNVGNLSSCVLDFIQVGTSTVPRITGQSSKNITWRLKIEIVRATHF